MTTLSIPVFREPREYLFSALAAILLHGAVASALFSVLPVEVLSHRFDRGFEMVTLAPRPAAAVEAKSEPEPPASAAPPVTEPAPPAAETVARVREKPVQWREAPPVKRIVKPEDTTAEMATAPAEEAGPGTAPVVAQKSPESFTAPNANVAYLNNPLPLYPRSARRRHIEGTVLLFVAVGPDGRATGVTVQSSSGFEPLDRAALEAVTRWRFEPARRNGVATTGEVLVPVRFNLENS